MPAMSITGPASTLFGFSTDDKIRDAKQQKHQHYHMEKSINMNILQLNI